MAPTAQTDGSPVEITDDEFDGFVNENDLVVVDFWAPWCGPCKRIAPVIEELAEEYEGRVAFAKLNTDENPKTPQKFGVMSIPTLLMLKGGSVVDQMVGAQPKPQIKSKVEQHLG